MRGIHITNPEEAAMDWRNWAGNQRATAHRVVRPAGAVEIASVVAAARADGRTVRAVGAGHSFTGAAATDGIRLELPAGGGPVSVDGTTRQVTVPAGMPLHRLNALLTAAGLAMPN